VFAGRIPYIDLNRIYVAGFALGGTVALHAAALDARIAGIASFSGFTPMRLDTPDKPTGGIRRLYEMHALIPRLGLFQANQSAIPYDYDELLRAIGIRKAPALLYTPMGDRDATFVDVISCIRATTSAWQPTTLLTHLAPNSISKMEEPEAQALSQWLHDLSNQP